MTRIKTGQSKVLRQFDALAIINGIDLLPIDDFEMQNRINCKKPHRFMKRKISFKIKMDLLTNYKTILVDTGANVNFPLGMRNNRKK